MQSVSIRRSAVLAVLGVIAASVAVLNFGGAAPQAALQQECRDDHQSPSPSGSPSGTGSPSPSQSTGGILPTGLPLPTGSSSPSSASPTPSESTPSDQASRCDSTISIRYVERFSNQDPRSAFKGRVRSADSLCIRNRRVILKRKTANGARTEGGTVTNRRGNWRIFERNPRGRYFAETPEVRRPSDHGTHICEAARSRTIRP